MGVRRIAVEIRGKGTTGQIHLHATERADWNLSPQIVSDPTNRSVGTFTQEFPCHFLQGQGRLTGISGSCSCENRDLLVDVGAVRELVGALYSITYSHTRD